MDEFIKIENLPQFASKHSSKRYFIENKYETVHRFALRAIRVELLEREREKEREIVFRILYTGYLLSIIKIKKEIESEREREREREKEKEREETEWK